MDKSEVAKQLETYSNAIVAFIVFQGLAFCYTFGTNDRFNATVKANLSLSVGLAVLFFVSMGLSLLATRFLGRRLAAMSGDHGPLVRTLYRGKAAVICLLGTLPLVVAVRFGVFGG